MGLDIKKLQEEKRLKEMSRQNKDENQLAALTKIMTAIKNCFEEILQTLQTLTNLDFLTHDIDDLGTKNKLHSDKIKSAKLIKK